MPTLKYEEWKKAKDDLLKELKNVGTQIPVYEKSQEDFESQQDYEIDLRNFLHKYPCENVRKFVNDKLVELIKDQDLLEMGYADAGILAEYYIDKGEYKKALAVLGLRLSQVSFLITNFPERRAADDILNQAFIYHKKLHHMLSAERHYLAALNLVNETRHEAFMKCQILNELIEMYIEIKKPEKAKKLYYSYYDDILSSLEESMTKYVGLHLTTEILRLAAYGKQLGKSYEKLFEKGLELHIEELKKMKVVDREHGFLENRGDLRISTESMTKILEKLEEIMMEVVE